MDKEIIVYIIFLAIALLGRLLGGKKQQKQKRQRPASDSGDEPIKTFEELLEEFTSGRKQSAGAPRRDLEEMDVPASVESRRRRKSARELIEDEYEEEERPFSFEPESNLKSIDEMVDIHKVKTTSSLQSPQEEEKKGPVEEDSIRAMLQNPEDARKAIILGEILNRKYH